MAVRVQNSAALNFGTMAAAATVTHVKLTVGSATLAIKAFTSSKTVAANGLASFPAGAIDIVFVAGDLTDAGLLELLKLAFDGTNTVAVDLQTDATTVVADTGYSQQSTAGWSLSTENDPS